MGGRCEAMATSEDAVNKLLPLSTGFWVSLERVLDGNDHNSTCNGNTMSGKVPVGILIVDEDKSWLFGRRGVGIRIRYINFQADTALVCSTQGKE